MVLAPFFLAANGTAFESDWTRRPSYPLAPVMAGPIAGAYDGVSIAAGGANFPDKMQWGGGKKVYYDEFFVLVPGEKTWRSAGKLPERRACSASASIAEGFLVIGGENSDTGFQDTLILRSEGKAVVVERGPALPAPRTSQVAAVLDENFYVAGGYASGAVRVELNESDFIVPFAAPLGGRSVRIVAPGDSSTRGARLGVGPNVAFPARLEAALRSKGVRVSARGVGVGSEHTDLALARLERDVLSQRPDIVTVMNGTNDSRVDQGKTTSRLTADAFDSNLNEMIGRLYGAKIQGILMTPPRFAEVFPRDGLSDESNAKLAPFADRVRKLAS
jgi:lysophospholipase L1-like esterase